MLNIFPIDFIRQVFEQKLLEEHNKNIEFFGGKEQVNIFSFYEQLESQDEVDRFVENYRDLADQQNRSHLILNGVLVSPENPTITNLYSSLIVPMTFTCSMRCLVVNRDQANLTINNLIYKLKGRKVDIAQLKCRDENDKPCYKPFVVGTIGQGDGAPIIKNGDYLGQVSSANDTASVIASLISKGLTLGTTNPSYFYVKHSNKLKVVEQRLTGTTYTYQFVENDGTIANIVFPPEHTSFEQYKISFSFDAIRCDEPRNLNAEEYCELSFGGSATLVNNGVQLGNDLLKISFTRYLLKAETPVDFTQLANNKTYWLEPLEMPSGSNADTRLSQLIGNKFINKSHTDSINLTLQYTFIADFNNEFLEQLFDYARYGTQGIGVDKISPNIIYTIHEIWCSWGNYKNQEIKAKIVENVDIENTESDTLTLSLTMQIQGEEQ